MLRYQLELTAMDPESIHIDVKRFADPDDVETYVIDKIVESIMKVLADQYNLHPVPSEKELN